MIKVFSLFLLILIATTGCKAPVNDINQDTIETPNTVATYDYFPEALNEFPPYPESPEKIAIKEFDTGYEIEMIVPNPYAVARAAWITVLQERLWQIENEIVILENNFSWVVMKKESATLFIKMESIYWLKIIL